MFDDSYDSNTQSSELFQQNQQTPFQSYDEFFKYEYLKSSSISQLISSISPEILSFHKVAQIQPGTYLSKRISNFDECMIDVRTQHLNGMIFCYDLVLGYFHLKVFVVNYDRNVEQKDSQVDNNIIGVGGFGTVREAKLKNINFAIKRIYFKTKLQPKTQKEDNMQIQFEAYYSKHQQIKKAIREYGIYKICSMLQIGPKVMFEDHFDLQCYNDCIQFYMELCDVPYKSHNFFMEKSLSFIKVQEDLKSSLFKMHLIKFIHRDIKPQNILFSQESNKFLLTDFGLAHLVKESYKQKTLTTYSGTLKYSSPQMLQLYNNKSQGYVNLYENDVFSLQKVFENFKQLTELVEEKRFNLVYNNNVMSRNSMSFVESYSQHYSYEQYNSSLAQQQNKQENNISNSSSHQISTNRSIPFLSTFNTNSLESIGKNSSVINFYVSRVLKVLFRKELYDASGKSLSIDQVYKAIDENCDDQIKEIINEVKYQISYNLFPRLFMTSKKQSEIKLYERRRKLIFFLKCYGPSYPPSQQLYKQLDEEENGNKSINSLYCQSFQNKIQSSQKSIKQLKLLSEQQLQNIKTKFLTNSLLFKTQSNINELKKVLQRVNASLNNQNNKNNQVVKLCLRQYVKLMCTKQSLLIQLDIEILNSLIEPILDRISNRLKQHELSQEIKNSKQKQTRSKLSDLLEQSLIQMKQFIQDRDNRIRKEDPYQFKMLQQQNRLKNHTEELMIRCLIILVDWSFTHYFIGNTKQSSKNVLQSVDALENEEKLNELVDLSLYVYEFTNKIRTSSSYYDIFLEGNGQKLQKDSKEKQIKMNNPLINLFQEIINQLIIKSTCESYHLRLKITLFQARFQFQTKKNCMMCIQIIDSILCNNNRTIEINSATQQINYSVQMIKTGSLKNQCQRVFDDITKQQFYYDCFMRLKLEALYEIQEFALIQTLATQHILNSIKSRKKQLILTQSPKLHISLMHYFTKDSGLEKPNRSNHECQQQAQSLNVSDQIKNIGLQFSRHLSATSTPTLLQKCLIIKKLSDAKFHKCIKQINQGNQAFKQELQEIKHLYLQVFILIKQHFPIKDYCRLVYQIVNNLSYVYFLLGLWSTALVLISNWFMTTKVQNIQDNAELQWINCNNFITIMLNLGIILEGTHYTSQHRYYLNELFSVKKQKQKCNLIFNNVSNLNKEEQKTSQNQKQTINCPAQTTEQPKQNQWKKMNLNKAEEIILGRAPSEQREFIIEYNKLLPIVILDYIRSKIDYLIKNSIVKRVFTQRRQNMFNIEINIFNFKRSTQTYYTLYSKNYGVQIQTNYDRQLFKLKQLAISACKIYGEFAMWNFRNLSKELSQQYYLLWKFSDSIKEQETGNLDEFQIKGDQKVFDDKELNNNYVNLKSQGFQSLRKSLHYLWNYVQVLFECPHIAQVRQLQDCLFFIQMLVKTRTSYRRALLFLKKIVYYIPPSEYMLKKRASILYTKIVEQLYKQTHQNLQYRWIKRMINDNCELLLSRKFESLTQFNEGNNERIVNALIQKWVKMV